MHAKESALSAVYKYLCGQKLRVGATEKIWGELGGFCCFGGYLQFGVSLLLLGLFLNLYSKSGKHMKKQFVYDIFMPKQNPPELNPLHSRLHKSVLQMQKKADLLLQVSHSVHRNTCQRIRCSFDTLTLLNVLNLSITNQNMRMHTQWSKNMEYWHCSLVFSGGCQATYSCLSFKSGCWIHAEQSRKCTWTLPPGTDLKGQTETVIQHAEHSPWAGSTPPCGYLLLYLLAKLNSIVFAL